MDRRQFLQNSIVFAAGTRLGGGPPSGAAPVTIELHPGKVGPTVPANFTGLGFESAQLDDPEFFSARIVAW